MPRIYNYHALQKPKKMKPTLLVPILIDAMVVDENQKNKSRKYALNTNDYRQLLKFKKPNLNFLDQNSTAQKGVHLQWLLPESLTQGKEINGKIEFPKVPNRWLVNRLYLDESNEIQIKSWLVLSDFVEENPNEKSNFLLENNGQLIPCKLGKTIDLSNFQGDELTEDLFLTVMTSGDAAFSVFTPENKNVFSFIDELQGLESKKLTLSYQVSAWYSNQNLNPINIKNQNIENIINQLHQFNFTFSDVLEIEKANDFDKLKQAEKAFEKWAKTKGLQTDFDGLDLVCHGTLHHVLWNKNDDKASQYKLPELETKVIVANSNFDGILRLIQEKMKEEERFSLEKTEKTLQLLAAFQHDLTGEIDNNGGLSKLEKEQHESWFSAENGGTIWEINAKNTNNIDLDAKTIEHLNRLNSLQIELDKQLNLKHSQKSHLYFAFINYQKNTQDLNLKNAFETELKKFNSLENDFSETKKKYQELLDELNFLLKLEFPDFELKQYSQAKFWEANEPVLLIHAAKGLDKYAYNKVLKCRYSGQTISNLKEHYSSQLIDFQSPTLPNQNKLPLIVADLIKETILINPDFSDFLLKKIEQRAEVNSETIKKQQTLIWNDEIYRDLDNDILLKIAGFSGKRLALKAFSKHFNNKNFSPLFLDWQVNYYPNGNYNMSNWKLNNFKFELENIEFNENIKLSLSGRTLLSTQTALVLSRQLKKYQKNINEENDKLLFQYIIDTIDSLDIVSQQLSGFNEMLSGIDINDIIPIKNIDIRNKVEGGNLGFPMDSKEIYPLRSGFLVPQIIQITDDFGQVISPIDIRENRLPQILKAQGTEAEQTRNTNISLLPPRFVQKVRLKTDFIGVNSSKPIHLANEDSPILAWIMTNYLDKSLTIYNKNGQNIGDLMTFKRGEKGEAKWLINDTEAFPNPTIENFVNGLINYENSGSALSAMMNTIDDGLMLNQIKTSLSSNVFSLLFGQALALVKVRFSLETKGFIKNETIKNLKFPLKIGEQKLGNNGVIGYFKNEDFTKFHTLNDKNLSAYLSAAETETISLNQDLELIILMNPNGFIHTISGIVPTTSLQLAPKFQKAIEHMEMKFRVKPILTAPTEINLPQMGNHANKMVWQQTKHQANKDIKPMSSEADFGKGRNVIREGWLFVK